MFVVLEGLDGCGKTTQTELVCKRFEADGIDLVEGNEIRIVKDKVKGNINRFSVNHPEAIDLIEVGHHVLIDNALLDLAVIEKGEDVLIISSGRMMHSLCAYPYQQPQAIWACLSRSCNIRRTGLRRRYGRRGHESSQQNTACR